jgi:hypothetical protein
VRAATELLDRLAPMMKPPARGRAAWGSEQPAGVALDVDVERCYEGLKELGLVAVRQQGTPRCEVCEPELVCPEREAH